MKWARVSIQSLQGGRISTIAEHSNNNFLNPEKYQNWNVTISDSPTSRYKAYNELCNMLRPIEYSVRQDIIDELADWAGLKGNSRNNYHVMSADEIRDLTKGGLIDVGGHTQTHPVLAALSYQGQIKEIKESKKHLENILERPVTSYSYPYGTRSDYTFESVKAVKQAGFSCACSNFEGKVGWWTNQFQLPRFLVRNWGGEEFASRLLRFFHG